MPDDPNISSERRVTAIILAATLLIAVIGIGVLAWWWTNTNLHPIAIANNPPPRASTPAPRPPRNSFTRTIPPRSTTRRTRSTAPFIQRPVVQLPLASDPGPTL